MSIFYLDYENGNDSTTTTPLGWWSIAITAGTGAAPTADIECSNNGQHAHLTVYVHTSGSWAGNNEAGTLYFYGKTGAFAAGTLSWGSGGTAGSGTIAGDATYCAWKTMSSGGLASRLNAGDTLRLKQSPVPFSLGNAVWTPNAKVSGGFPTALSVTAAASNGGLIQLTMASTDTLATNDIVKITGLVGTQEGNGLWKITVDDATHITLQDSAYVNARSSGGTVQKVNSATVVLPTAKTKSICPCNFIWTADNSASVALPMFYYKIIQAAKVSKASPSNNTLYAHFTIPDTDYSDYQTITLWVYLATAITAATQWSLCLCSDTAGATVVDTFPLPVISAVNTWIPITIAKSGGGNLGDSIQSIALYSGSAAASSTGIYMENIHAAKSNELDLQTLISTNSKLKDGSAGWYALSNISASGKILTLDVAPNTMAIGRGWGGSTGGTLATYGRKTIKTDIPAGSTLTVQQTTKDGAAGSLISYEGGYDAVTNSQIGETFFDGLCGWGNGIYIGNSFVSVNHINPVRYSVGFTIYSANNVTIPYLNTANNNASNGVYLYYSWGINIGVIGSADNNGGSGIHSANSYKNIIGTINSVSSNSISGIAAASNNSIVITSIGDITNNTSYALNMSGTNNAIGLISNANYNGNTALYLYGSSNSTISTVTNCNGNTNYAVAMDGNNNHVNTITTTGNTVGGVYNTAGTNYLRSATLGESTKFAGATDANNSQIFSEKHGGVANTHYVYTDSGYVTTAAISGGTSWEVYPTNAKRNVNYPMSLDIATIYCKANRPVIIYATVSKSHATDIAGQILIKGGQIAGVVSDLTDVLDNNTNEQTLSIPFTPTGDGTVTVKLQAWWLANTADEHVTLHTIKTNARKYGKTYLEDTKAYVEFGYVVKYDEEDANPYITEATQATVHAYTGIAINDSTKLITLTANHTIQELYDYVQDYLSLNPLVADFFYTTDGVTYTCDYDMTVDGCTLTATGKIVDLGSNTLTLSNGGAVAATRVTDVSGTLVSISLLNVVSGSQCYVEKTSDHTELMNVTASGTTAAVNYTHTGDVGVTIRVRKAGYQEWTTTGTITTSGLSLTVGQASDATY